MKFKIDDRTYDFDGEYTVEEAMIFWDHAQVGMSELQDHFRRGNPYVAQVLMYVLKRRAGEAVRLQDLATLNYTSIQAVPEEVNKFGDDDVTGTERPGEAPDPTADSGMTPEPDTGTTSSSSPTISTSAL